MVTERIRLGTLLTPASRWRKAWEEAGATWWIESWWSIDPGSEGLAEVRRRVQAGPPSGG